MSVHELIQQNAHALRRLPGHLPPESGRVGKRDDVARVFERCVYAWMAAANLEGELAQDRQAVGYFRQRQRELERAMNQFQRA